MRSQIIDQLSVYPKAYFNLVGKTEAPLIYHRWTSYSILAALLGRQVWLPFGHWTIYPNLYIQLMGDPGARKSSSISIGTNTLKRLGYDKLAADRTSKERFLMDMLAGYAEDEDELMELTLDGITSEVLIAADEFTDFTGKSNSEFLTTLGKLWDTPPEYKHPKIHGKSIIVPNPCVNILSGSTPQAYSLCMPIEAMGQGFMSRLIHIHGEPTGIKITIPEPPTQNAKMQVDSLLDKVRGVIKGAMQIAPEAIPILDRIYKEFPDIEDYRFKYYNTRRFTHLLKLAMTIAASRFSMTIEPEDAIAANTLLFYTEIKMPTSLGEYGKARNADIANAVINIIKTAKRPVTIKYIWKQVAQDLNRQEELQEIIRNLTTSGKLKLVEAKGPTGTVQGYMTNFEKKGTWDASLLWDSFLFEQEKF